MSFVLKTRGHSGGIDARLPEGLRLWPGCETVNGIAVLANRRDKFTVHVVAYGQAKKHIADRAIRFIQRAKARYFYLKLE